MYLGHDMLMTDLPTPSFCKRFKHVVWDMGMSPPWILLLFVGTEWNTMG